MGRDKLSARHLRRNRKDGTVFPPAVQEFLDYIASVIVADLIEQLEGRSKDGHEPETLPMVEE